MTTMEEPNQKQTYEDFYMRLRKKINEQLKNKKEEKDDNEKTAFDFLVDYLALLPDLFHLAVRLMFDGSVPAEGKGALLAALAYTASPIDLIPDTVPVAGWVDDLIVITMGLNQFFETKNEAVALAVKKYWVGDEDVFKTVKHILSIADSAVEFLPKKFMKIVKDLFKGKK